MQTHIMYAFLYFYILCIKMYENSLKFFRKSTKASFGRKLRQTAALNFMYPSPSCSLSQIIALMYHNVSIALSKLRNSTQFPFFSVINALSLGQFKVNLWLRVEDRSTLFINALKFSPVLIRFALNAHLLSFLKMTLNFRKILLMVSIVFVTYFILPLFLICVLFPLAIYRNIVVWLSTWKKELSGPLSLNDCSWAWDDVYNRPLAAITGVLWPPRG